MLNYPSYDVFLSYKAGNANAVRGVAEHMMAHGLKVWFGEYLISSEDYDERRAILEAIHNGVQRARCHVVFTNNLWARAPWCRAEMRLIRHWIPDESKRILQVLLPDEEGPGLHWPELNDVPSMQDEGDASAVLAKLQELGWIDRGCRMALDSRWESKRRRMPLGYGLSMGAGPFRRTSQLPLFFQRALRRPGDHSYLTANVSGRHVHLLIDINPHRTVLGALQVREDSEADEREVYRAYLRVARDWIGDVRRDELGYHLVFLDGRSHFGMTTVRRDGSARNWERRYALLLDGPKGQAAGELDVTFAVAFGRRSIDEELAEFASMTPVFDGLVESIRRKVDFGFLGREWWAALVARLVILVAVFMLAEILFAQAESWFWRCAGVIFLGAVSCSSALFVFDVESRRKASGWGITIGPKVRWMVTLGAWLDRAWNRCVGAIVYDFYLTAIGMVIPVSWIALLGIGPLREQFWYWWALGAAFALIGAVVDRKLIGRMLS